MAKYIVNQRTFLFSSATDVSSSNHPIIEPFTRFEGGVPAAILEKTDDPPGFVDARNVGEIPASLPPITSDVDKTAFCRAVTDAARLENSDRDYLLAVAYFLSKKLTDFGKPDDAKLGPFAQTVQDWRDALPKAAAAGRHMLPVDMFNPISQAGMAAVRAGKAMDDFATAASRPPLPVELFFFERMGPEGIELLKLAKSTPTTTCANAITGAVPDGSFAAEIKARGTTPIATVIQEVTAGLMSGFGVSRTDVNRLPIHLRYFHDEDFAPWLAVARMLKGDALQTSTDKLAALFMSTIAGGPPPSATFVGFCMNFCGDPAVKANLPGANQELAQTWATWASKAPDPAPAGTVVLTDATVPQGIGILGDAATGDTLQVYLCSRDDATAAVKVELKPVAKSAITAFRFLDLSTSPVTRMPGANDTLFVQKAPKIMTDLLHNFPNLKDFQAAGILGNIGHECGGFRAFQEIRPSGRDGRGGLGWCQWTDERRTNFEDFAASHGGVLSDEANFGNLLRELNERPEFDTAIRALLPTTTADEAMREFERTFEKAAAGQEGFPSRLRYAEIALSLFRGTLSA
jgi:Phage tail lysozyme